MKSFFIKIIFVFVFAIFFSSCSNSPKIIYKGQASIIGQSFDTSLLDSAMIYGHVLLAYPNRAPSHNTTILVVETGTTTFSDSTGFFSIKLLPGTYSVMCSEDTPKLNLMTIHPNEKVEVEFIVRVEIW